MARTMTAWIMEQPGLTSTAQDRWRQYLINQGELVGTNNDRMTAWLSATYTGTLQDIIKQWSDATLD